jgi:ABC-type Fe3+/spermidine/putrescine transport system ATPase subunit
LARAIINEPRILLLDEPLSALDEKLRMDMQQSLKVLKSQMSSTFIYVTHNQDEALSMGDRIAVMKEGRIEQVSTPEDLYNNPVTRFIAEFVGEINELGNNTASPGAHDFITMIRPEFISVSFTHPVDSDHFMSDSGRIIQKIFKGNTISYLIESARHPKLKATAFHSGREREINVGDEVFLQWDKNMVKNVRAS